MHRKIVRSLHRFFSRFTLSYFLVLATIFNSVAPALLLATPVYAADDSQISVSYSAGSHNFTLSGPTSDSYHLYYQTPIKIDAAQGSLPATVYAGTQSSGAGTPATVERGIFKTSSITEYFVVDGSTLRTVVSTNTTTSNLTDAETAWLADPATYGDLVTGTTYHAPFNQDVSVTFTSLPNDPGTITFHQVTLTDAQVKESGALTSTAYEITSTMTDDTFSYTLTLPNPSAKTNVGVQYSEDGQTFSPTANVSTSPTTVTILGLTHFTIFVVTTPSQTGEAGACVSVTGATSSVDDKCFNTIQAAIGAAVSGDTINVAAGTYTEVLNLGGKTLTIEGAGVGTTVIDASALTGYAIQGFGDSSAVKGLTLKGTSNNYGFKISGVSEITLENIKVENSKKTGVDLNGVNGGTLNNVEITGTVSGFGINIVDSKNITLTNITTSSNGWGGVSVQTEGYYYPGGADNIVFSGSFNAGESAPLFLEEDPCHASGGSGGCTVGIYSPITNVTAPSKFEYKVYGFRTGDNYKQTYYQETLDIAKSFAKSLAVSSSPVFSGVIAYDITEGNYYVEEGMKIQDAIIAATSGDTVNVAAGDYAENLTINKAVSLLGPNATINPNTDTPRVGEATITGQITDYAGNTDIKGFTITNPSWNGVTIKGIHIYSAGPVISDIIVQNNILENISNANTNGSYGVMVQGALNNVSILNNKIEDINSAGWSHAIEVTPTSNSSLVPQNTTITGNAISNITNPSQSDAYAFSVDSAGATLADASQVTFNHNSLLGNVRNLDTAHTLNASNNWWGSSNPTVIQTGISDNVTFRPYYTDSAKTILSPTDPGIPTTVSTSPTNNTTPTWSWTSSIDADHYLFYWSTILGGEDFNSGNISEPSYTHTNPLTDAIWYTKVLAYDTDGNTSPFSDNSGPLTVDATAPTGTITINDGATITNSHTVTLTISASADLSGITQMNIANTSSYYGWENYATSKTWTLSENDGPKEVRIKFRDAAGNETSPGILATITVDTTKPVITLTGVTPDIEVGGSYTELGATANDGSTVSITGSVNTFVVGSYTITYNATDVAGNPATPITRTVNVVDTTKPVITLVGSDTVTLEIHNTYTDAGVSASDNYDGNLTSSVVINPTNINKDVVGSYTVTYNVVDDHGNNATQVTRTVNVVDSIDEVFNGISDDLAAAGIASNMSDVTTDNIQSFPGLYFEKSMTVDEITTKMGKITFNSSLDLSKNETRTFLENLGTKMDMAETGIISLDFRDTTSDLSLKGVSATIEFYGLDALGFTADSTSDEVNSKLIAYDDDGNILDKADLVDDPGTYTPPFGVCEVGGACYIFSVDVNHFTKYKIDEATQTTPNIDGDATLSGDTTEVVLTDPDQAVDITIADGTDNPTIDVSAFITDGQGDIPPININSDAADISIPATGVTGPEGWDGIIAAPTVTTVDLPVVSGETSTLGTAIEIGFATDKLSFDNAVRILLPGQAGKRAGYSRPGTVFTEITSTCSADTQEVGDALLADTECKIDVGSDLIIWTKHFTKFAAYTQTTNSTSSSSSSSSTSSTPAPCNDTKPGTPTLLSATSGLNSVLLRWAESAGPLTYYLVAYGLTSGSLTYGNPNIGGSGTTSYTVNNLSGGTRYYFQVRSGNGCATGEFSNVLSATPTGGTLTTPTTGFEPGVLGAETTADSPTVSPTPSPTTENVAGDVLGSEKSTQNSFDWRWLWLLLIPAGIILILSRRRSN